MGKYEIQVPKERVLVQRLLLATVVKNTAKIKEYIANQLKEDELCGQLTLEDFYPFTGSR